MCSITRMLAVRAFTALRHTTSDLSMPPIEQLLTRFPTTECPREVSSTVVRTRWRLPVCERMLCHIKTRPIPFKAFSSTIPGLVTPLHATCRRVSADCGYINSYRTFLKALVDQVDGPERSI